MVTEEEGRARESRNEQASPLSSPPCPLSVCRLLFGVVGIGVVLGVRRRNVVISIDAVGLAWLVALWVERCFFFSSCTQQVVCSDGSLEERREESTRERERAVTVHVVSAYIHVENVIVAFGRPFLKDGEKDVHKYVCVKKCVRPVG